MDDFTMHSNNLTLISHLMNNLYASATMKLNLIQQRRSCTVISNNMYHGIKSLDHDRMHGYTYHQCAYPPAGHLLTCSLPNRYLSPEHLQTLSCLS